MAPGSSTSSDVDATTARVDMTLTVCMVMAFLFFQLLYRQRTVSRAQSLIFFLLLGLATLAKGPVGDMVPKSLRREPKGVLELKHQRDGLRNKQTHRIKAKEEVGSRK